MEFYAYLWLREDGTPYYVGKGTWLASLSKNDHHQRVYTKHRGSGVHPPKDRSRILIFERFNEAEVFATEKELIVNWGRKDLGTGCLHNRTEGGDGASGFKWTEKQKQAIVGKRSGEKCYWLFGKRGPETPRFGKKAPHSEETKHKMSEIRRGRKLSEEHRKAVAAGQRTDKARAAMSATIKEWWRIRKAQKENSNSI